MATVCPSTFFRVEIDASSSVKDFVPTRPHQKERNCICTFTQPKLRQLKPHWHHA